MCPKDVDGMTNSVDPDQTAPWVCTVCQDLSVRKLRIITVAWEESAGRCESIYMYRIYSNKHPGGAAIYES